MTELICFIFHLFEIFGVYRFFGSLYGLDFISQIISSADLCSNNFGAINGLGMSQSFQVRVLVIECQTPSFCSQF